MTKSDMYEDRRKFKRAIFTLEDGVIAMLGIPGVQERAFKTYILNLSEGGIQFTLDEENIQKIHKGERVIILQIEAPFSLRFLVNIDAEIKWVLPHDIFEHVGAGCEFINITPTSQEQISAFVKSWTESRQK